MMTLDKNEIALIEDLDMILDDAVNHYWDERYESHYGLSRKNAKRDILQFMVNEAVTKMLDR